MFCLTLSQPILWGYLIQGMINVEIQSLGPFASISDINQGPALIQELSGGFKCNCITVQLALVSSPLLLIIIFLRAVQAHTYTLLHFSVHFQGSSSH